MRGWISAHPVLAGLVAVLLVGGGVVAFALGRGLTLMMIWGIAAVLATLVFALGDGAMDENDPGGSDGSGPDR